MPPTTKKCPLNGSLCDPLHPEPETTANLDCSFFVNEMLGARCIYIEAMKALPKVAENITRIKLQS